TEGLEDTVIWQRGGSSAVRTSAPLLKLPGVQPVFSPNGRVLATTVVSNSTVRLWGIPSGRRLAQVAIEPNSNGARPTIAFRGDGAQLVILSGGQLQTWDTARGTLVRTEVISDTTARLSPDARTLATYNDGSLSAKPGIRLTRIADGHVL